MLVHTVDRAHRKEYAPDGGFLAKKPFSLCVPEDACIARQSTPWGGRWGVELCKSCAQNSSKTVRSQSENSPKTVCKLKLMLSLAIVFARLTIWRSLLPKLDVGGSNPLARCSLAI